MLSTVSIQHLASLEDVVSAITGQLPGETVPDEIVRRADQIELVDVAPELLLERLTAGNIYPAEMVDAALANEFRLGNLFALREIALIWLADRVDEGLAKYRANEGITATWPARERVVVGLTGGPEGEALLRRASRILSRVNGGDLLAVHVRRPEGQPEEDRRRLASQRRLSTDLGGSYHTVVGEDAAKSLLEFARSVNATQIVVGVSRGRLASRLLGSSVGSKVVRGSGDIDVHMVSHPLGARALPRPPSAALGRARTTAGFILAVLIPGPDHNGDVVCPGAEPGDPHACPSHRRDRRGIYWWSMAGGVGGHFGFAAAELLRDRACRDIQYQRPAECLRFAGVPFHGGSGVPARGPLGQAGQGGGPRPGRGSNFG